VRASGLGENAMLFLPDAADGGSDYIPRVIKELAEDANVLTLVCGLPHEGGASSDGHRLSGLGEAVVIAGCHGPVRQPAGSARLLTADRSVWTAARRLLLPLWPQSVGGGQGQGAGHAADGG
jgi:hypothetical protein